VSSASAQILAATRIASVPALSSGAWKSIRPNSSPSTLVSSLVCSSTVPALVAAAVTRSTPALLTPHDAPLVIDMSIISDAAVPGPESVITIFRLSNSAAEAHVSVSWCSGTSPAPNIPGTFRSWMPPVKLSCTRRSTFVSRVPSRSASVGGSAPYTGTQTNRAAISPCK